MAEQQSNKSILYMTLLVLLGMAVLLVFNLSQIFSPPKNEKYLAFNDVKGMAIEHNGLLYTLNFDQQNSFIEHINRSLPVGAVALSSHKSPMNFTKLIVYRFDKPDLLVTPVQYDQENLIFSCSEWNGQGYLKDVSYGSFKALIATTYDP